MAGTCAYSRIPRWPSPWRASPVAVRATRCGWRAAHWHRCTWWATASAGLVIYRMFETGLLAPDRFSGDFCRVVFMGTPVRGSQSGRTLARLTPLRNLLGAAGTEELLSELPRRWEHKAQLGVIAGDSPHGLGRLITRLDGPNDGTVAVSETAIEGATDRRVVHASHMGMLVATEAARTDNQFPRSWSFRTGFGSELGLATSQSDRRSRGQEARVLLPGIAHGPGLIEQQGHAVTLPEVTHGLTKPEIDLTCEQPDLLLPIRRLLALRKSCARLAAGGCRQAAATRLHLGAGILPSRLQFLAA